MLPVGVRGKPRPLFGAQLVALDRDRFHACLERIAAEGGHCGKDGCEDGDADQQCYQKAGVEDRADDLICHGG
jgi:hypothetical protein